MNKIIDMETLNEFINNNNLSLIIAKTNNCGVCDVAIDKVGHILKKYPQIKSSIVLIDDVPEFSGQYVVFTAPTILLFVEEFRYIPVLEISSPPEDVLNPIPFVHLSKKV